MLVRDPVYVAARREALVIVGLFALFFIWSVGVCYAIGFISAEPADAAKPVEVATVLGMPTWIFWGILMPWLAVDLVAVWFCFSFMTDDDLGEDIDAGSPPPKDLPEHKEANDA